VSEAISYHFVIADDHPLFRGAMRQTLETVYPGAGISEVGSLEEAVADLDAHDEVDLLLLDLSMPGMRGFSGLMYLRAQYQGVPVVIVSATEDVSTIRRCMELGASGFIPKSLGIEVIRDARRHMDAARRRPGVRKQRDRRHGAAPVEPDAATGAGADDAVGRAVEQADRL
jgi:DNA-binding NarL/FixJ family response regulator